MYSFLHTDRVSLQLLDTSPLSTFKRPAFQETLAEFSWHFPTTEVLSNKKTLFRSFKGEPKKNSELKMIPKSH